MPDPVVVTAVFFPKPGARAALLDAMQVAIPAVHAEAGCELYAIHDAPDGSIVMLEKWTTGADLDAHGDGEAVAAFRVAIDDLLEAPATVTRLAPIPVGAPEQGAL